MKDKKKKLFISDIIPSQISIISLCPKISFLLIAHPDRSSPRLELQSPIDFLQPPTTSFTVLHRRNFQTLPRSHCPRPLLHVPDCHGPRQDTSRSTQPITVEMSTIGSLRVKLRVFGVKCASNDS